MRVGQVSKVDRETRKRAAADLRARIEASPKLPFHGVHFVAKPPAIAGNQEPFPG